VVTKVLDEHIAFKYFYPEDGGKTLSTVVSQFHPTDHPISNYTDAAVIDIEQYTMYVVVCLELTTHVAGLESQVF
jgi:hypothetical protein